jgi:hypothetical protein
MSFSDKTLDKKIKRGVDIEVYGASMFHRRLQRCVGDTWTQDAKVRLWNVNRPAVVTGLGLRGLVP